MIIMMIIQIITYNNHDDNNNNNDNSLAQNDLNYLKCDSGRGLASRATQIISFK